MKDRIILEYLNVDTEKLKTAFVDEDNVFEVKGTPLAENGIKLKDRYHRVYDLTTFAFNFHYNGRSVKVLDYYNLCLEGNDIEGDLVIKVAPYMYDVSTYKLVSDDLEYLDEELVSVHAKKFSQLLTDDGIKEFVLFARYLIAFIIKCNYFIFEEIIGEYKDLYDKGIGYNEAFQKRLEEVIVPYIESEIKDRVAYFDYY